MVNNMDFKEKILFEQNYAKVQKAVYFFCDDFHLSEEATQEAFYNAFKNIRKLKDTENFPGWVYKIATNYIKKKKVKERKVIFVNYDKIENNIKSSKSEFEQVEIKEDIRRVLQLLKPEYRQAIILFYFFDLTIGEVANILNIKESTIKTRLHRGRNKMYDSLSEDYLKGSIAND